MHAAIISLAVLIIRSYAIWERSALVLAYLCLVQVVRRCILSKIFTNNVFALSLIPALSVQASFIVEVVQLEQSLKFVTCALRSFKQ